MKTMVLQFMLEGQRPWTILCFNVHPTVEYLNKNVSIGQLLQHIPNSIVVCAGSRLPGQTKTYNKEVCLFRNSELVRKQIGRSGVQVSERQWKIYRRVFTFSAKP